MINNLFSALALMMLVSCASVPVKPEWAGSGSYLTAQVPLPEKHTPQDEAAARDKALDIVKKALFRQFGWEAPEGVPDEFLMADYRAFRGEAEKLPLIADTWYDKEEESLYLLAELRAGETERLDERYQTIFSSERKGLLGLMKRGERYAGSSRYHDALVSFYTGLVKMGVLDEAFRDHYEGILVEKCLDALNHISLSLVLPEEDVWLGEPVPSPFFFKTEPAGIPVTLRVVRQRYNGEPQVTEKRMQTEASGRNDLNSDTIPDFGTIDLTLNYTPDLPSPDEGVDGVSVLLDQIQTAVDAVHVSRTLVVRHPFEKIPVNLAILESDSSGRLRQKIVQGVFEEKMKAARLPFVVRPYARVFEAGEADGGTVNYAVSGRALFAGFTLQGGKVQVLVRGRAFLYKISEKTELFSTEEREATGEGEDLESALNKALITWAEAASDDLLERFRHY